MSDTLDQEIRHLRTLYWSDRDPQGRAFAPLADACIRANRLDEASELLEDGLSRLPEFLPGLIVTARLHEARGDIDGAEAAFRSARKLDPDNSQALFGLGRILAVRGEETGVEMVERARALDPTVGRSLPSLRWAANMGPDLDAQTEPDEEDTIVSVLDLAPDIAAEPDEAIPSILEFAPDSASAADRHEVPSIAQESRAGGEAEAEFEAEVHPEPEAAADESEDAADEVDDAADEVDDAEVAAAEGGEDADEEPRDADEEPEVGAEEHEVPTEEPGTGDEVETVSSDRAAGSSAAPEDDSPVVTTRTLAELFVKQGLTDRAVEVYEKLVARSPDDEQLKSRLDELTRAISSDGSSEEAESDESEKESPARTRPASTEPLSRLKAPSASPEGRSAPEVEEPDDHMPEAPHPHPEDPTPFGWASTDDDPADPVPEGASIAAYFGRLLAFTPGAGSDDSTNSTSPDAS